jgi:hypothetical protein
MEQKILNQIDKNEDILKEMGFYYFTEIDPDPDSYIRIYTRVNSGEQSFNEFIYNYLKIKLKGDRWYNFPLQDLLHDEHNNYLEYQGVLYGFIYIISKFNVYQNISNAVEYAQFKRINNIPIDILHSHNLCEAIIEFINYPDLLNFELSKKQLQQITDSLDGTGGFLIKENELKYWIERYVNEYGRN